MATNPYKLSASLQGHEDDVRGVSFPSPNAVISVSRDATVRLWKRVQATAFDDHINSTGSAFVNSVTYVQPFPEHPSGLIVSAGQDTIIEVREPESKKEDADYLLLGHTHNVCALDAISTTIVSGSWDGTARVWQNWEAKHVLEGHEGAVWAVLALSDTEVVTGGADKTLRLWRNGQQVAVMNGHTDCVRGLCKLGNGLFASCANDATIRIWSLDGREIQQLHGHTNYIYSVDALPSGEIISAGEDRTLRIWKDGQCVQTITHPALSVWSVAGCAESGEIVSGASDRIVRIFTRDESRVADAETLKAFDDSVKASSIPSNQVGEIEKDKLPGVEALQKRGTKDGQVLVVKNGDVAEAHVWSAREQSWTNVGTVVDTAGSGQKKIYDGKEYDYVFDVDIQEGAPPLKLPYNVSENPFDAARRFLENNELPMSYLDTVGNFIVKNSEGVSLDQQQQGNQPDPWGTESRYRPGESSSAPPPRPKYIPQTTYLSITTANLAPVQKKLNELNQELLTSGNKDLSLNPEEISTLAQICSLLQEFITGKKQTSASVIDNGMDLIAKIMMKWPPQNRIPALDLLRLLTAASPMTANYQLEGRNLVDLIQESGSVDKAYPNNVMLVTRAFVNLFQTEDGKRLMGAKSEQILGLVKDAAIGTSNRNLKIAYSTLLLNYSVLFKEKKHEDGSINILDFLTTIIKTEIDSESVFRALVGLGTAVSVGLDVKEAATGIFEAKAAVRGAVEKIKEPRIKHVAAELDGLLQ